MSFKSPEVARKYAREWQRKNRRKCWGYVKKYRLKNKARYDAILAEWKKLHRDRVNKHARDYRQRHKQDIQFRLRQSLRSRIKQALSRGIKKSGRTLELIGCPVGFLKTRLEHLFKPGMSWENYGLWQIDHIRPCSSFDLSDPNQQEQCFHFSNLQPLWASENRKKFNIYGR